MAIKDKSIRRRINENNVTMTFGELQKYEKEAIQKALIHSVKVSSVAHLLVLRDMGWGKVRLERFIEKHNEVVDSINKGYITIKDMHDVLEEEVGIKLVSDS